MADVITSEILLALEDFDGNVAQITLDGTAVDPTGSNFGAIDALQDSLRVSLAAVMNGTIRKIGNHSRVTRTDDAKPTDPYSQTNVRWRFTFTDNVTGSEYNRTMGPADLSLGTLVDGETVLDLGSGAGATLKADWDAYVVSIDGNPTTLNAVKYVQ